MAEIGKLYLQWAFICALCIVPGLASADDYFARLERAALESRADAAMQAANDAQQSAEPGPWEPDREPATELPLGGRELAQEGSCSIDYAELMRDAARLSERPLSTVPQVHFVTGWGLNDLIFAFTRDSDGSVWINADYFNTLPEPDRCSVIVHEFVHVLQGAAGDVSEAIREQREQEAYEVQSAFMIERTLEFLHLRPGGIFAVRHFKEMEKVGAAQHSEPYQPDGLTCHAWRADRPITICVRP